MAYLGDKKKGHFPAKCSIRIAINLSTDPKTARCTITGLANPGLTGSSSQMKS